MHRSNAIDRALGMALRRRRQEIELSQEQVAERAGVHPVYVAGIERGEHRITLSGLEQLANALDIAPSELLRRVEEGRRERRGGAPEAS